MTNPLSVEDIDGCAGRDEAGFCIPAQWGWPGCFKKNGALREFGDSCECPPDLETARQHHIRKIQRKRKRKAAP